MSSKMTRREWLKLAGATTAAGGMVCLPWPTWAESAKPWPTEEEARRLGHDAYIYSFPLVQNYLSIYQFAIDRDGTQYKGPINQVHNVARVFTPADTGVITPNSDTPYSFLVMDLRAEPMVVTLPPVERDRYYSLQLVDLYTNNVDYLGTRRDGNGGGTFLIVGPDWKNPTPAGIKRTVRIGTSLMYAHFRTQLFDAADIEKVKAIQSGYKAEPLSSYLHRAAAPAAPKVDYPKIDRDSFQPRFWEYTNFLLQFCPVLPTEASLREKFVRIGVQAGVPWPPAGMSEKTANAVRGGGESAQKELDQSLQKITSSVGLFGSPEEMAGKYKERALGALGGIYGNTPAEAVYPAYLVDTDGKPYDTSKFNYTLTFAADALPPVQAFWSVTMYDGRTRFLVENPIHRYLINSNMLPELKKNGDGAYTLYLQKTSPGPQLESNWLPAPDGIMAVVMRLYLPQPSVLEGKWTAPRIEKNGES